VFRLDDFVIVQPEAVLGIIQVKRTFKKVAKEDPLKKGVQQAIDAKRHLLDVLFDKRPKKAVKPNIGDLTIPVFSAVIAFDKADDASLKEAILASHASYLAEGRYLETEISHELGLFLLPTFVGALRGFCAYARRNHIKQTYFLFESEYGSRENGKPNISLQLLLSNMMDVLQSLLIKDTRPFAFPSFDKLTLQLFDVPSES
jgi:hypothetical protein